MKGVFIELPAFERHREEFLADDEFAAFQQALLANPEAGDLIQGTGGLRKVRWADSTNHRGKRGGARIIYYYHAGGEQFFLFTVYGKSQKDDLSDIEKRKLRTFLEKEVHSRFANVEVKKRTSGS